MMPGTSGSPASASKWTVRALTAARLSSPKRRRWYLKKIRSVLGIVNTTWRCGTSSSIEKKQSLLNGGKISFRLHMILKH